MQHCCYVYYVYLPNYKAIFYVLQKQDLDGMVIMHLCRNTEAYKFNMSSYTVFLSCVLLGFRKLLHELMQDT